MPTFYPSLTEDLITWLQTQPLFFTASAPRYGKHVNLSPKGYTSRSFRVLSPNQAAYLDATGSGSETISHIYENGRVTVMFTSFSASPRILRLFCTGRVVEAENAEFDDIVQSFGPRGEEEGGEGKGGMKGARAVVLLDIFKVQTSCGYGVPIAEGAPTGGEEGGGGVEGEARFGERETMERWAEKQIEKGNLETYRAEWNSSSLDGLPGLRSARREKGERALWVGDLLARAKRVGREWEGLLVGLGVGVAVGFGLQRYLVGR
ncbi:unnamed protein product [Tuber melanosporum]|uniref:(Perigord truffle) hypothetical protein n=1 Tax=Tuber melanosporum (strain Mel28) TaxID=656061 RepID=D5G5G7_TUBMM|nr:uncharacterized protein GSTUM_00004327001 [Tuber melanosporum]CAZ79760.1 unnamed protein product [Tuber melanosporum]